MILRLLIVILLATMAILSQTPPIEPGVSQTLAKWRAANYSDVRYKLNLTLEKMSPTLKGTIEIRVNVRDAGPARRGDAVTTGSPPYEGGVDAALGGRGGSLIILDWRKIKGFEDRSTIANVSINGRPALIAQAGENHPVGETPTPLLRKEGSLNASLAYSEINEHLIFRDGVVAGENIIKLDFTSPILTSGSAITRYVDKEDGAEYIYSLFVPSDASTAFPVFDQPDLKARFSLTLATPDSWRRNGNSSELREDWKRISNAAGKDSLDTAFVGQSSKDVPYTIFEETKPISTYVFAFAAGPFVQMSEPPAVAGGLTPQPSNSDNRGSSKSIGSNNRLQPPATAGGSDRAADPTSHIYVRKSQAEKFKPHAAEVFRLNREGVKYLESYFDYKFPFPKYDLVLIPEFPFGGMEHAGVTFLREDRVIFPTEPTKNDYITRANLIFHEAAHQWFGDTVTMKWFDDLWLKEGFAEFMAYKTLEKVMPEYNAWKIFYERNKQAAYLTDSTKGTTPIYQEISNLNAAKSAYGNIVYRKAPSFLKQAEFYIGPDKFQTAVRAFLKKHEFANAGWENLVKEFETAIGQNLKEWADFWVKRPGVAKVKITQTDPKTLPKRIPGYITLSPDWTLDILVEGLPTEAKLPLMKGMMYSLGSYRNSVTEMGWQIPDALPKGFKLAVYEQYFIFPNYQDYGYGIFLLDDKSRDYVLKNIQTEKDDFLRTMMWGSLWDSVREAELAPQDYVELVVKNLAVQSADLSPSERDKSRTLNSGETDESTIQTLLARVSTAMTYYLSEPPTVAGGLTLSVRNTRKPGSAKPATSSDRPQPPATAGGSDLTARLESVLIERMQNAPTTGQRITFYRGFLNIASTENARGVLKEMLRTANRSEPPALAGGPERATESWLRTETTVTNAVKNPPANAGGSDFKIPLKSKDKFDIVTKLLVLGDPEGAQLLAQLEKAETSDEAKRYAYAAKAGIATAENKAKFWNDFITNKEISESWIEAAFGPFNSPKHAELTLPFLEKALAELPNLKRGRKIFFVNGWLAAFIGGQRSEQALAIVNKFLADNPNLDKDLRLKILENVDLIERAVKIRGKSGKN